MHENSNHPSIAWITRKGLIIRENNGQIVSSCKCPIPVRIHSKKNKSMLYNKSVGSISFWEQPSSLLPVSAVPLTTSMSLWVNEIFSAISFTRIYESFEVLAPHASAVSLSTNFLQEKLCVSVLRSRAIYVRCCNETHSLRKWGIQKHRNLWIVYCGAWVRKCYRVQEQWLRKVTVVSDIDNSKTDKGPRPRPV